MSPTSFRSLIIFSVLLGIASAAIDFIVPDLIPGSLTKAYENVPTPAIFENPLWLAFLVALLLLVLVSTFGLLFFKRWARTLSLYTTIFGFVLYPFFGLTLVSGWANALSELSTTIWGAALAIAYYSSLSERFSKVQKNACSPTVREGLRYGVASSLNSILEICMSLPAKAKWFVLVVMISLASAGTGYWLSATREQQTQYQLLAFHLTSSLSALRALQQNDITTAKHSLEISATAGVLLSQNKDSFLTSTTREAVKDGLEQAKCYGNKYGWKSISSELKGRLNNVLKDAESASCDDL